MSDTITTSSVPAADWRLLWAKSSPRHPLWKHMVDAAAVSLALPASVGNFGWKAEEIALLVGLHDIGKADSCFQYQIDDLPNEFQRAFPRTADAPYRHERFSAAFLKKLLVGSLDERAADAISRAVVAHHGRWDDETPRPVGKRYQEAQQQLHAVLQSLLQAESLPSEIPPDLSAFGMRLAGHIVLCDWIASNEAFYCDPRLKEVDAPQSYLSTALEVARGWVRDLGLDRDGRAGRPAKIVATPRPIQQAILEEDIPPALVIIEAPMGEGKTEAAWILAEKWRGKGYHGMYMALPTMATSDSLYGRYRDDYLEKLGRGEDVKLVHGMAWLRDEKREPEKPPQVGESGEDRSIAAAWFRPTRRAMLAAHGVGTVDQAMLAGMNVRFGFLRLYGLSGRVLVIDEVHAYDAYMSTIIARLLQWCSCLRIPVVLLSATLSAGQRAAMIEAYGATGGDPGSDAPYPLITVAKPGEKVRAIDAAASSGRTLKIETHSGLLGDVAGTAEMAVDLVREGGCCCVILNTVKQAQALYRALELPESEKLLFHARFTASDRELIAEKVLSLFGKDASSRPAKFVLVATQVVEQSLDVDFDHMISEIAPVDLLLQRSGRLHRHRKRAQDPVLHVLLPKSGEPTFGGTGRIYAEKPLLRTLALLAIQGEAHLPTDFRRLIERCYGTEWWEQDVVPPDVLAASDDAWSSDTQGLRSHARQFALTEPRARTFRPVNNDPTGDDSDDGNGWRAKTRLGANDRTAVLVQADDLSRLQPGEIPMKEVRSLYRRSLKLPSYLPLHGPAPGYGAGVEAEGRLRGLVLLPVTQQGVWQGQDEKGNRYEVAYDEKLGLLVGRLR